MRVAPTDGLQEVQWADDHEGRPYGWVARGAVGRQPRGSPLRGGIIWGYEDFFAFHANLYWKNSLGFAILFIIVGINFDDTINGSTKYNLKIQGDNTSKVILNNSVINANASLTDTNLYISERAFADTRTNLNANSGTVHFANGKSENYQINQLTSLESVNYTVDVDLTKLAPVPDTISTGEGSSGTVTISDINFNGELKDFNAQILKTQDDNIQLGLSDNLKDKYNTTSTETIHTNDTVQANVNWKDKFNKYEQTNTTTTGLSLGTTNTTNDSIEYLTKTTEGEKIYQVQWAIR